MEPRSWVGPLELGAILLLFVVCFPFVFGLSSDFVVSSRSSLLILCVHSFLFVVLLSSSLPILLVSCVLCSFSSYCIICVSFVLSSPLLLDSNRMLV